jgi:endo-1,4-beta-D-glucanase Y
MNRTDLIQALAPAELATTLDTLGRQLSQWTQTLRNVDEVLRICAESQQLTEETRKRHEQILAQIAEAERTLADIQAERLQLQADRDATQERWEAEDQEQMQAFLAERERLQREIEGLQKRRRQGEEALSVLRTVLATVRSQLDSMSN